MNSSTFKDFARDKDKGLENDFATHVNVYLVRGLFSSLCYPFAYFATNGITPSQLFLTGLEAVRTLNSIGFQVRAMVSDGASVNRKFFSMLATSTEESNWTWNPHNPSMILFRCSSSYKDDKKLF